RMKPRIHGARKSSPHVLSRRAREVPLRTITAVPPLRAECYCISDPPMVPLSLSNGPRTSGLPLPSTERSELQALVLRSATVVDALQRRLEVRRFLVDIQARRRVHERLEVGRCLACLQEVG